ncbi:MAG: mismatch repair protein MutL [Bacteriovoracaceae bacterium]|nr:mismatch repair protein MutL [Bacteriovoracaceae bacterium]
MIQRLAPHIVHQIAAGEVVERPASALKELIENALDAKASKIAIEFEGGGLNRLIVDDDGVGMTAEDLPLAFEAHATSKLKELDDFRALSTFGFRGEAICSLASVSDLEIWSSARDEKVGSRGRVVFGSQENIEAADKRLGTRITVKNLFHQHPARLKFMKSVRSETQALSQVFRRYVLCEPEITWILRDLEAKKETRVSPSSSLDRVLWYFDSDEREHWLNSKSESSDWKIEIMALRPRFMGKIKSGISLFLNQRPFKDSKIEFAVRRGFEGFAMNPRDISAVVFLNGSPELFDVNVHPMKSEVRFVNPDLLFSEIVRNLRAGFEKEHQTAFTSAAQSLTYEPKPILFETPARSHFEKAEAKSFREMNTQIKSPSVEFEVFSETFVPPILLESKEPEFQYIASLDDTYLIAKKAGELFLFDQHALHERIIYERLLHSYQSGSKIPSQRLLFPIPLVIEGAEPLLEQEETLEKLGFELRLWNDKKIQIIAAPHLLKRDYAEVLTKLSHSLELPMETMAREVLSTMACHSAVRAHDRLEREEIERLLKDFATKDALGHCPHGRPTFIRFQVKDLEKMFRRVM